MNKETYIINCALGLAKKLGQRIQGGAAPNSLTELSRRIKSPNNPWWVHKTIAGEFLSWSSWTMIGKKATRTMQIHVLPYSISISFFHPTFFEAKRSYKTILLSENGVSEQFDWMWNNNRTPICFCYPEISVDSVKKIADRHFLLEK